MSPTGVDLRFAVSGGRATGLGHVMRCATLAREARSRGLSVDFALAGDELAVRALEEALPGVAVGPWRDGEDAAEGAAALVLDAREALGPALAAATRRGVRTVVLDRVDHLDDADWTVLPILHGPALAHPRLLQGADWCIVEPAALGLGAPPHPGRRDLLLVTLGGSDPHDATRRVATALERPPAGCPRPLFVVGPAAEARRERSEALRRAGFEVVAGPARPTLFGFMARARLAIAGFGITAYELAWLGTPALHVTQRPDDGEEARRLEAAGIGRLVGDAADLEPGAVRDALERALDPRWLRRASEAGRAALADGCGTARVVDLAAGEAPRAARRAAP